MKIAYFFSWDISKDSGVLTKAKAQIKEWIRLGHEVRLIVITPYLPQRNSIKYINPISIKLPITNKLGIKTYLTKIFCANKILNFLKNFNPDILYMRQELWFPGIDKIISAFPTILELNTNDLDEIKFLNFIKRKVYLYGRERILKNVRGFVSVSNEIENLYKKYNKPIITIANGYDLSIIPKEIVKKNSVRKQVIFVGTEGCPWHGVEKIYFMAKELPQFDFHIVGLNLNNNGLKNLYIHGYKNKKELFEIYKNMDVGIGTLSLYKKNMEEASPLKVREYIAFKLPVIVGYKDTDLNGKEYVLNIGNYQNNVIENINKIKDFINKSNELSEKINSIIISYKKKEKKRICFFYEVIQKE